MKLLVPVMGVVLTASCPIVFGQEDETKAPTASSATDATALPELVEQLLPSVVTVLVYGNNDETPMSQGSGWFESPTTIVTCYHVIEGGRRAEIRLSGGKIVPVLGVSSEDKALDLAVLAVQPGTPPHEPASRSRAKARAGQEVFVIGAPLGLDLTVSEGVVSSTRNVPSMGPVIQTTAAISPGSSGSPLFDRQGRVIGTIYSRLVEGHALNFAVPVGARHRSAGDPVPLAEWSVGDRGFRSDPEILLLWFQDKYEQALSLALSKVEHDPNDGVMWFVAGDCLRHLRSYEEAIKCYEKALSKKSFKDLGGAVSSIVCGRLGEAYLKTGRTQEAHGYSKRAVREDPRNVMAHTLVSSSCMLLGRLEESIDAAKHAIRLDPDYPTAHVLLGQGYESEGRYDEAAEAFKQAIRLDPDEEFAHLFLGMTYQSLERHKEAIECYQQVGLPGFVWNGRLSA